MNKRGLSVLLSLVLAVSLIGPTAASAGVSEGDVCRIDSTGYATLSAALTAVTEGQTIVLLADVVYGSPIVSSTRAFSLDLSGCDLTVESAQVYCLASTGGKQLSVLNSSEAESRLTITQTIAAADLATASGFGAIYTSGASSRIVTDQKVAVSVTTNMKGVDASAGNSIQIGNGVIRADRCGIDVANAGSVLFTGDVYGLGSGADGVSCRYGGDVQVNGTVYSDGIGVDAQSQGHVSVTRDVLTYDAHGTIGAYAFEGAIVQITGNVTAPNKGVFAEGGTISVEGSVTGGAVGSYGAYSKDTISPAMQGTVTVSGSVYGQRYGAYATEGGTVVVGGDAYSRAGSASYSSAAVNSRGVGSTIIVTGNASAAGQDSSGIEVYAGGTAEVNGNIAALGDSSHGVRAYSGTYYDVLYGSTATVNGTITATKYILIGATVKSSVDWDSITSNGYYSFSGAYPLCYVSVKVPALSAATPAASPAGGAVAAGTAVTLTTATSGAEIRYTLDGSVPTDASSLYTAPISVTAPVTLKAAAFKSGITASSVMTETYTILMAAEPPVASPAGGALSSGTAVTLTTATPGAEIRYTLDGSAPSLASTLYTAPIPVSTPLTIRAVAILAGVQDSEVMTETYTIQAPPVSGSLNSAVCYQISATAGSGGTITPKGGKTVEEFGSAVYSIRPDSGFIISDVLVDGVSAGRVSEYRFSSVRANHTIEARFAHDCPSGKYMDVDTARWYHEGIDFVLSKGLFAGMSPSRFEPDSSMTRAMAVMTLYRLAGAPPVSGSPYADVAADAWYAAAAAWGTEAAVTSGYGNGKFGPGDGITREQFAVMLYRYAVGAGIASGPVVTPELPVCNDAGDISEYALPAVKWACSAGLLGTDSSLYLRPGSILSRAEAAALLTRLCREIE